MLAVIVLAGAAGGRLMRLPGAGLLGPMALTIVVQLSGLSFGLAVPAILVHVSYMLIGWQAGVAFTREALRTIERMLPTALALIVVLNVAAAGLGVLLARVADISPLDGYLATSPGGVYAVLATAVDTGANVTFVIAAQVIRILLMLFSAPLVAQVFLWLGRRRRGPAHSTASSSASSVPIRAAD
jgi:membrane AbrB-like protein